jgi:hypothetical protein
MGRAASFAVLLCLALACGDDGSTPDAGGADAGTDAGLADGGADAAPPGPVFHPGPYGDGPRDVAGPFVVRTLDGSYDFEAAWTGEDHHVLVLYAEGQPAAESIADSDLVPLFEESPPNVRWLYIANGTELVAMRNAEAMRTRVEEALLGLPAERADGIRARVHYVVEPADFSVGSMGEYVRANRPLAFGIDRFQRFRSAGLLQWPLAAGSPPQVHFLAYEAQHWEFEHRRELALDPAATVVTVFDGVETEGRGGSATVQAMLPSATEWERFDTLEVDAATHCRGHREQSCWEWDRIGRITYCRPPEPPATEPVCDVEVARLITTYHREGRWVTDATHALALLPPGGPHTFRFEGGDTGSDATPYVLTIKLRFRNRGLGMRPVEARYLFGGGAYDAAYNDRYAPVAFTVPADVRRVDVVALVTGHGFGVEVENCAEFCAHTHHFDVNGREWVKEHPEAGTVRGCLLQIDRGVVPNQYGTWPLGRGGWCPGLDVPPFVADVTEVIRRDGDNVLTYRSLLDGAPYVPVPASGSGGGGFPAQMDLGAWLVFWR